jgi:hypothetical protein
LFSKASFCKVDGGTLDLKVPTQNPKHFLMHSTNDLFKFKHIAKGSVDEGVSLGIGLCADASSELADLAPTLLFLT